MVGGYAVGKHGYPRATIDLDVWVKPTLENGKRIMLALEDFGFESIGIKAKFFGESNQLLRMGVPPLRIEVMTTVSGVDFDTCYRDRVEELIDGVPVQFIDRRNLLINKKAAGRNKDLADLDNL